MSASTMGDPNDGDLLANAEVAQLVEARAVIERAKGILMHRYRIEPDTAFEVLRRYSQDGNVKLHDVAEELGRTLRLPDDPPELQSV